MQKPESFAESGPENHDVGYCVILSIMLFRLITISKECMPYQMPLQQP